jgi:hypothetical protein
MGWIPEKLKWHPTLNPWGKRIGKIEEIWAIPCKPTPELWVKAFWQVLPGAVWHAIKPSPIDFLIIRIGFSHHRSRKWKWDIWDFHFNPQVPKAGIGWQVFKLGALAARALWYIAVIDAAIFGIRNWMSLAYQWNGCLIPGAAYAASNFNPMTIFAPGTGPGFVNSWLVEGFQSPFSATSIAVIGAAGFNPALGATFECAPYGPFADDFGPPSTEIRVFPLGTEIPWQHSTLSPTGLRTSFFSPDMGHQIGSTAWGIYITAPAPGWSIWSGGAMTLYGNLSDKDLSPDP